MRSGCVLDSAAWLHAQPKVQGRHIMVLYCFMRSPCLFISPATAPLKRYRYGWISSSFSWQIQCLRIFGGKISFNSPYVHHFWYLKYLNQLNLHFFTIFDEFSWQPTADPVAIRGHPWPSVACRSCCPTAVLSWHFRGRHLARDHGTHHLLIYSYVMLYNNI